MRWAIVGLAIACAVGVGTLVYGRIATTTRDDAQTWRQRELAFLKSVHDRIRADLAYQSADGGAASLREEDDKILQAMAVVAKLMPADSVPGDIRVLLPGSDPPEKDAQAARIEAVAMERSVSAATERSVLAELVLVDWPIAHPSGASIQLKTIEFHRDSITLSATIANPGDRAIRLNRARRFVLTDSAHGVHHLNPPLENSEVEIPAHTEMSGNLVFIGPFAPLARQLNLSTNEGINHPVLKTELPLDDRGDGSDEQADDPGGAALRVGRVVGSPTSCIVSLLATNGSDRTIVLNERRGLIMTDEHGVSAPVEPPPENRELVVPDGARLDAELVFDCRRLDLAARLTLATNQGTALTTDNAHGRPVFTLKVAIDRNGDHSMATSSRASVALIARSQLSAAPTAIAAAQLAGESSVAMPPPAVAGSEPSRASPEAPSGAVVREASSSNLPPKRVSLAPPATQRTLPQLEAALHAEKTDRGLRVKLSADALFGTVRDAFDLAVDPPLSSLAELIEAMQPREIVVIGHTDASGEDDANLALSKKRAHAVAAWLGAHGPPKHQPHFVERGYGRTRPVAPNDNADGSENREGRQQNRRIEILLRRNL